MPSVLNMVEKYIKDLNNVDLSNIMSLRLPQSKSYLKILGILYFVEDTNLPIISNIIEWIIYSSYILLISGIDRIAQKWSILSIGTLI